MSITCECGAALSLPNIQATRCGVDHGEIQAMAFVKLSDMPTVGSGGTATDFRLKTNLKDKSVWQDLLSADTPKVTISPEIFGVSTNSGDETTWTGNDGVEMHVETNPSEITGEFRFGNAEQMKAIRDMRCLAQNRDLGVYLFDGNGNVIGQDCTVATGGDGISPIPVRSIFVGDISFQGRQEPDFYSLSMKLDGEYSHSLAQQQLCKNGEADMNWRGVDLIGEQA